ncbi:hypothetical protein BJ122_101309 [Rhodopseudomonas faecalis]|uniref:Uncharacterized protein n=1 Tax=Rhodopseudomonas faecalis TaxID=99655 RepID=A0A318TLF0_9BRAD|nr:hypothetical protein [Rhodopseudomonas faecalis]PYF05566.1 hypothetical protein BJ122_101309 [Rhodopseudomonas faecalis]
MKLGIVFSILIIAIGSIVVVQKFNRRVHYNHWSPIVQWQSYSANSYQGIHEWVDGDYPYRIEMVDRVSKAFRSGYAFVSGGRLILRDLANEVQFRKFGANYVKEYIFKSIRPRLINRTHEFSFDYHHGVLSACLILGSKQCQRISVKGGSFPYVYAISGDSVLAITNYADALLFKGGRWCRMVMEDDVYRCDESRQDMLVEPRKIQFYSSIIYQSKTLIGEWPTGRLYEFDGDVLKPSTFTPPAIQEVSLQRLGYEAQSMAEYCGDLFVGYWPKGEIWRFDHKEGVWGLFFRAFSPEVNETFIPYAGRPDDGLGAAFFGQRVTALVPFEESLYVATSNLREWKDDIVPPSSIPADRLDEYGRVYRISRYGCQSSYR